MVSKILYKIITNSNPQYIEEADSIEIDDKDNNTNELKKIGIDTESIHGNRIRISTTQGNVLIYWNLNDYRNRVSEKCLERDSLIINDETQQSLFFESESQKSYQNFIVHTKDFLLENTYYYFKTLNHLKANEHKEDHLFYFVDHFNSSFRKIIFTSLNKEGKLTITYPIGIPLLSREISYKTRCEEFYEAFSSQNVHLPKFIKNEMFKTVAKEKIDNRIVVFFDKLDEILIVAKQNFELYINDLSLDKFKIDYIEYKEKYFSQLRDILGKLTTQVIALPLSITAAAFAIYKTSDKPVIFILILISFLLFSLYSFFLIRLYKFDVLDLETSFGRDFKKLSSEDYFIKFPNELISFFQVETSIKNRIKNLKNLIFSYSLLLAIINSLFICFSILQKGFSNTEAFAIGIVSFIVFCIILNFLIWKIKLNNA